MKTQNNENKKNKGSTLVEALIALGIVSFVIVSILSGISQQQLSTQNVSDKNAAVMLAEMRMEELLKFPSGQLSIEEYTDYIVQNDKGFVVSDTETNAQKQFRRTTTIKKDLLQQVATVRVRVDYGKKKDKYPFHVELVSRRGIQ